MLKAIQVYIVDDHKLIIEGMVRLLENESSINICGYAATGSSCLQHLTRIDADIILMDINLPDINGIELCQMVKKAYPTIKIIALSTIDHGIFISKMLDSGANGYILKNAEKKEILEAIYSVSKGEQYLSMEVSKIHRATINKQKLVPTITKREKEILKLIIDGNTNTEIAHTLSISIDTVDTHRRNLYAKLNVKNLAQLIKYSKEHNLTL
jgi:DNA-binding NarL/FixJ family response regulator